MTTSAIIFGLLFGTIGLGFFMYGKKQQEYVSLACGIGLMAFPYFVTNTILLCAIGVALMAIPVLYARR
jgi:ABC-type dipeptide/oligopeptide/nickel transport system permease component